MLVFTAPPLAAVLLSPPGGVQGQRGVQGLPILAAPRAFTSTMPQLAFISRRAVPRAGKPIAALDGLLAAASQPHAAGIGAAAAVAKLTSPLRFGLLYAFCDLLIPLNIGLAPLCGAMFDFPTALAIVLTGGVAAATAAFFIGRMLLQDRVRSQLQKMPTTERQFSFIDRAITRGGFRAVFLLRLIPTPVPAINFLYGLTGVSGTSYMAATALGNLPGSVAILSSAALGKQLLLARGALHGRPLLPACALGLAAAFALVRLGARAVDAAKAALDDLAGGACGEEPGGSTVAVGAGQEEGEEECELDGCRPWLTSGEAAEVCA